MASQAEKPLPSPHEDESHHEDESRHLEYRPDIDGLRAVAVLSVLVFHAFPEFLSGGFVGVDVFFVISGFLISRIIWQGLANRSFTIREFYARRVRRIFPALAVVLGASWIVGLTTLYWDEFARLGKHIFASAIFGMNFFLLNEGGYFDVAVERKPLLHVWSLSIEEQFYLVWPIILIAVSRSRRALAATIVILGALSLGTSVVWTAEAENVGFYHPMSRAWELLLGSAVGYLATFRRDSLPKSSMILPVGLALIAVSCLYFSQQTKFPGFTALLPTLGAAMVLLSSPTHFLSKALLQNRLMVGIGLISYPLYLWHWPLLSFAFIQSEGLLLPWVKGALLTSSLVLAWVTYYLVERPLRSRSRGAGAIIALVCAMMMLGGLGGLTYRSDGFVKLRAVASKAPFAIDPETLLNQWYQDTRSGTCHNQDAIVEAHKPVCTETLRPRVLLWGDSHAASLYPGLRALQETRSFGLTQLTTVGCPPFLNTESIVHHHCPAINQRILTSLSEFTPEVIILNAAWVHDRYAWDAQTATERLLTMIREIQSRSPNSRIIVIGPQLRWHPSLPEVLAKYVDQHGTMPPVRLPIPPNEFWLYVRTYGHELRSTVEAKGAVYILPEDILCENDTCLTRSGDGPNDLFVHDYGHLTAAGSRYFISQIADQIFESVPVPSINNPAPSQ